MICETEDFRIPDHNRGTTWDGISFLVTEKNEQNVETPVDFTGAIILAQFKNRKRGSVVFEFKSPDQTIVFGTGTVSNPTTGEIVLKPRLLNYPAYDYYFTVRATFADGRVDEIVEGWFKIED